MKLVEQHVIKRRDPRDIGIDEAAFASNNLMNVWFLVNISRAYGSFLTVARERELCYTGANKDRCSSQEDLCASAKLFSL